MQRRGLIVAAVAAGAMLGTSARADAACTFPKSWYTNQAELQYATDLYTGKLRESLATPANTNNLVSGNASRTASFLSAAQRYVLGLPGSLPRCP
jgi:hypothetical protein